MMLKSEMLILASMLTAGLLPAVPAERDNPSLAHVLLVAVFSQSKRLLWQLVAPRRSPFSLLPREIT